MSKPQIPDRRYIFFSERLVTLKSIIILGNIAQCLDYALRGNFLILRLLKIAALTLVTKSTDLVAVQIANIGVIDASVGRAGTRFAFIRAAARDSRCVELID